MDGDMALGFARERYSFEDGDNQRGKDQEIVLTVIIKKACSPAILKNANELVAGVSDSVQTNMTSEEISKFINQQIADPTEWNVESQAVSGRGDTQSCYSSGSQLLYVMWPDDTAVQNAAVKIKQVEAN